MDRIGQGCVQRLSPLGFRLVLVKLPIAPVFIQREA